MTDLMTAFLAGYVVPAGAGLAGDPGLKAPQRAVSSFCLRAPALALGALLHRAAATRADRQECARLSSSPNGADRLAKLRAKCQSVAWIAMQSGSVRGTRAPAALGAVSTAEIGGCGAPRGRPGRLPSGKTCLCSSPATSPRKRARAQQVPSRAAGWSPSPRSPLMNSSRSRAATSSPPPCCGRCQNACRTRRSRSPTAFTWLRWRRPSTSRSCCLLTTPASPASASQATPSWSLCAPSAQARN